jgi:hypothetical protein
MTLQMTVTRCVTFYCAIDRRLLGQMRNRHQKVNTFAYEMLHRRYKRLHLKCQVSIAPILPLYI